MGYWLLLVQGLHRVGEVVLLVLLALLALFYLSPLFWGVESLHRRLFQLVRALLHLQGVFVVSCIGVPLHLLLELQYLLLTLPQVLLQAAVHRHHFLMHLLQFPILTLLLPQLLVIEAILHILALKLRHLLAYILNYMLLA